MYKTERTMKTILNFQKSLLLMLSMAACFVSNAQFDPNFTQYMFNEAIINPGYAGSRECLSGTMLYRQQWVGLDGAPTTLTGSIHSPIMGGKMGAGINFVNEKIGVSQRTSVSANGAYRLGLKNATLSFGLQLGLVSLSENLSQLNLQNDQQFMMSSGKRTAPNLGFGMFYSTAKWYGGLSIPRMIYNRIDVATGSTEVQNSFNVDYFHYYLTGGGVISVNNMIKVRPNAMLKVVKGAPTQLDLNANVLFNDFIWTGIGYRTGDAVNVMLGAFINKQLRIGYSYDYTLSMLQDYNTGSHEVMIGYDLNFSKDKMISPRYF
jgi:type IX secretion system PorP/SprF family membrane protein